MAHTIHNLQQGSPQWLAYRQSHFNASEASAMLGVSTYQTRSALLKAKATGYTPDVDAQTQKRFDAGHDAEAAARPFAEGIIEQDLYPITASRDVLVGSTLLPLSASYDGVTMGEDVVWEHKLLNENLYENLSRSIIPDQYHPQLEQQLMVIGAEKALFMATSPDRTAAEYVWYTSNPELRQRLLAGWVQFAMDVAAYVPDEVIVPAVAAPQMGLPAVSITVHGSIALIDNMDVFGAALTAYVERINRSPETDQDFADLEATAKTLKTAEDALDAAETNALAQTESIDAMRRTVALYRDIARTNRLLIEKLVKAEKENRRNKILSDAQAALGAHIATLNARLGKSYISAIVPQFADVMKGLKSLDSMKDKVATELARCKIEANAIADRISANLETLAGAAEFAFLFSDIAMLVQKQPEDLHMLVKSRIADHQAAEAVKEEATRARIRAEEQAKAEKAAREKVEAEQAAAAVEKAAKDQADAAARAAVPAQVVPPAPTPELTHTQVVAHMPAAVRQAMAPKPDSVPTMTLGEISAKLGFNVTSAFLASLGFEATTVKAARLFHAEDFTAIGRAIIEHIETVCELQAESA